MGNGREGREGEPSVAKYVMSLGASRAAWWQLLNFCMLFVAPVCSLALFIYVFNYLTFAVFRLTVVINKLHHSGI